MRFDHDRASLAVDNKFQPDPDGTQLCDIERSSFRLASGRDGSAFPIEPRLSSVACSGQRAVHSSANLASIIAQLLKSSIVNQIIHSKFGSGAVGLVL